MNLVSLLILVIFLVLICIVAKWFVSYMEVPYPISMIIVVAVGLLCLLLFLNQTGLLSNGPVLHLR